MGRVKQSVKTSPFTKQDLKNAIPEHCFKRSYSKSFQMLALDLVHIGVLYFVMKSIDNFVYQYFGTLVWSFVWTAYIIAQGICFTSIWVIAHECGHESFVESKMVNDVVGYILHTMLLVPYFPWQKSHALHHHYTNNLQRDQVWVPSVYENENDEGIDAEKSTVQTLWELFLMTSIGWPLYLAMNATGPKTKGFVSHFLPSSEIFSKQEAAKVNISTIGILVWSFCLYKYAAATSAGFFFGIYLLPLVCNYFFLTSITYLQHTDDVIPHYEDSEWTWLKGAMCTVDRSMGSFIDKKLHYIHSHHVVHHLFSKLPSYNAPEATEALKKVMGDYYVKDDSNFMVTLYKTYKKCIVMTPDAQNKRVYWWKVFSKKNN